MKIAVVVPVNDMSSIVLNNYKSVQGENIYTSFLKKGYDTNIVYVDKNTKDVDLLYDVFLFSGTVSPLKFIHQDLVNNLHKANKITAQFVDKTSETREYSTTFSFAHSNDCSHLQNNLNHIFVNQVFSYDKLYPEQHLQTKPLLFVDHCFPQKSKVDPDKLFFKEAIQFAKRLYDQGWDVLRWTDRGLVLNDLDTGFTNFARVDHEELCYYYRRTSVFTMTHKESLGMSPVEAALCGATTVCNPKLLTSFFKDKINSICFDDFNPSSKIDYVANRAMALQHFDYEFFVDAVVSHVQDHLNSATK